MAERKIMNHSMVTVRRWLQRTPKQVLFAMTALPGGYSSSVKNS
jgi:hypothetical protein